MRCVTAACLYLEYFVFLYFLLVSEEKPALSYVEQNGQEKSYLMRYGKKVHASFSPVHARTQCEANMIFKLRK